MQELSDYAVTCAVPGAPAAAPTGSHTGSPTANPSDDTTAGDGAAATPVDAVIAEAEKKQVQAEAQGKAQINT